MTLPGPHSWQLYAFALSMLGGMAIGLGFDVYRAARSLRRPGPIVTAVGDVLFVLVAAVWTGWVLWQAAAGEPRLYVLVALAAGLSTYAGLASATVLPFARACWRIAFRVLRPAARAVRWLGRVAAAVTRAVWPVSAGTPDENN